MRSFLIGSVCLLTVLCLPKGVPSGCAGTLSAPSCRLAGEPAVRSLSEFEASARDAPEVLAAAADLAESLGRRDLVAAQGGWRFLAGAGAGQYREQVTEDYLRDYSRIDLTAGLKYPLFGALNRERRQVLQAQASVAEKTCESQLAAREALLSVRLSYIQYWAAQEKAKVGVLFLQDQPQVEDILQQRTQSGHLLEADRREFVSAFALARRNVSQAGIAQQRALGVLRLLSEADAAPFQAAFPVMPAPCQAADKLEAAIWDTHPKILLLKKQVEAQQQLLELAQKSHVDGYVALQSQLSTESGASQPGYGVGLNVSIEMPLNVRQAASAARNAARAALEKSRRYLEIARARLLLDAHEALGQFQAEDRSIDFALQRLSAAHESIRESLLRYAYLPGDMIEKYQQSRYAYYMAALDCIDALAHGLQQQAQLLSWAPAEGDGAVAAEPSALESRWRQWVANGSDLQAQSAVAAPQVPAAGRQMRFTVYVWDSQQLLRRFDRSPDEFFAALHAQQIDRLLISFTPAQINALGNAAERMRWVDLLQQAFRRGLRAELLLGEPRWLLPQYRGGLLDIIRKLADLPFQGIHLDLEPDQLCDFQPEGVFRLEYLPQTIAAVRGVTALPVGLSIHPRYLDPHSAAQNNIGRALEQAGLAEVALMIYTTNAQRTVAIAAGIARAFPRLKLSLAQSVEPVLSEDESYAGMPRARFFAHMAALQQEAAAVGVDAILIQGWKDFDGMQP